MSVIGNLVGRILKPGEIIDSVGNALDKLITNNEEREAAKLAVSQELNRSFEALARMDLDNLVSARNREVQLKNTIGVWVQNLAAAGVICSFVSLLFAVMYLKVPVANKDIFNILIGSLGTIVIQIFQYWFGSSAGSARRGDQIEKMLGK